MPIVKGMPKLVVRGVYGAIGGVMGAACMTIIRMAARQRGIIQKTVPQAVEEWMADRTGSGTARHPVLHHVLDQLLHLAYGAALAVPYGLTVRRRSPRMAVRGLSLGMATWLVGSWFLLPALGVKRSPFRAKAGDNAVDILAHLAYGAATALLTEELHEQPDRGPSSDARRKLSRIG